MDSLGWGTGKVRMARVPSWPEKPREDSGEDGPLAFSSGSPGCVGGPGSREARHDLLATMAERGVAITRALANWDPDIEPMQVHL